MIHKGLDFIIGRTLYQAVSPHVIFVHRWSFMASRGWVGGGGKHVLPRGHDDHVLAWCQKIDTGFCHTVKPVRSSHLWSETKVAAEERWLPPQIGNNFSSYFELKHKMNRMSRSK